MRTPKNLEKTQVRTRKTTNSTHIWRCVRYSNPSDNGEMRALWPLRLPCIKFESRSRSPFYHFTVLSVTEDVGLTCRRKWWELSARKALILVPTLSIFQPFLLFLFFHYHTIRSSNLGSEDAATYLERYRKEAEVVDSKLAKDRKRQEQKLHQKLTALKQKRIEEKVQCFFRTVLNKSQF